MALYISTAFENIHCLWPQSQCLCTKPVFMYKASRYVQRQCLFFKGSVYVQRQCLCTKAVDMRKINTAFVNINWLCTYSLPLPKGSVYVQSQSICTKEVDFKASEYVQSQCLCTKAVFISKPKGSEYVQSQCLCTKAVDIKGSGYFSKEVDMYKASGFIK